MAYVKENVIMVDFPNILSSAPYYLELCETGGSRHDF